MPHDNDDDAVIILSIAGEECNLPAEAAAQLKSFVGSYGNNAAEVARHFICGRLGIDPNAAAVAEEAVGSDTPSVTAQDETAANPSEDSA